MICPICKCTHKLSIFEPQPLLDHLHPARPLDSHTPSLGADFDCASAFTFGQLRICPACKVARTLLQKHATTEKHRCADNFKQDIQLKSLLATHPLEGKEDEVGSMLNITAPWLWQASAHVHSRGKKRRKYSEVKKGLRNSESELEHIIK